MRVKTTYILTDDFARKAEPPTPPRSDTRYYDSKEIGFCLRVHATGRRTWCVVTTSAKNNKPSLATLGDIKLSAEDARKKAHTAKHKEERGQSLAQERAAKRKLRTTPDATATTVATLAKEWLQWGRDVAQWERSSTVPQYERSIKKFVDTFGDRPAKEITSPDVQRCYNSIAVKSVSNALNFKAAMSAMFSYGVQTCNDIVINPASQKRIRVGSLPPRKLKFSDEQIEAIRNALGSVFDNHRGTPFLRLMDITGCRCSEAYEIRPDMVEGRWWKLKPDEVKQDAYHSYRLNAHNGVAVAMAAAESPLRRSQRLYYSEQLYAELKEYLAERGIALPRGKFHLFRKTRVTWLMRQGVPIAIAGKSVGHSSPLITERYFTPDELDMQEAIDDADNAAARRGANENKGGRKAGGKTRVYVKDVA